MRQLPEQCEAYGSQTATLETRVLKDGTEKRGSEVTFKGERRGRAVPGVCEGDGGGAGGLNAKTMAFVKEGGPELLLVAPLRKIGGEAELTEDGRTD